MHDDFIKSESVANKVKDTGIRRFSHWPTKRVEHAFKSLGKMQQAFRRCGSVDDSYSQISTLSTDVCQGSNEILAALSHWAETHLHECRNYQMHTDRMNKKWNDIYNKVLGCDTNQSVIMSTTGSTIESTTATSTASSIESTTATTINYNQLQSTASTESSSFADNLNSHYICDIIDGWTDQCSEKCYTYVHEDVSFYDYATYDDHFGDFACELKISSVCDPNFVGMFGLDCDWYDRHGACEGIPNKVLLEWGVFSVADGYKTGLNLVVRISIEAFASNTVCLAHVEQFTSEKNSEKISIEIIHVEIIKTDSYTGSVRLKSCRLKIWSCVPFSFYDCG